MCEIKATKCKVVREVPEAEWKEWLGNTDEEDKFILF